jgi:hypothetical protein
MKRRTPGRAHGLYRRGDNKPLYLEGFQRA